MFSHAEISIGDFGAANACAFSATMKIAIAAPILIRRIFSSTSYPKIRAHPLQTSCRNGELGGASHRTVEYFEQLLSFSSSWSANVHDTNGAFRAVGTL